MGRHSPSGPGQIRNASHVPISTIKEQCGIIRILNSEALTVYKIDYSDVDGKPEVSFMCLKRLVGERGFEPPTPWSRNRDSGVVLNVFNLLRWCFDRLSPARSPHSGVNVSPRMAVPDQGFTKTGWLGLKLFCRRDAPALGRTPARSKRSPRSDDF